MPPSEQAKANRRARQAKYRASGKHYAAVKRYRETAKGKATTRRSNAKQLAIGDRYVGYCTDAERATAINRHIKEKLSAFQRQQGREKDEGALARQVPPETAV